MIEKSPRGTLHYPKESQIKEFLDKKRKERPNAALWEHIEELVSNQPKTNEEKIAEAYKKFIEDVMLLFPGSNESGLLLLWELIARRILKIKNIDQEEVYLPDSYYEKLKKL